MLLFSSIFNIKMATQKFPNFDVFFKMHTYITAVTYNLTKLFQMKLRQRSATRAILQKKPNETFGQPNTFYITALLRHNSQTYYTYYSFEVYNSC